MNKKHYLINNVRVELCEFSPATGDREWHAMLKPSTTDSNQLAAMLKAKDELLQSLEARLMFGRLFLSDGLLDKPVEGLSCIGQTPLDGTEVEMWLWMREGSKCKECSKSEESLKHHFGMNYICAEGSSEEQSRKLLADYDADLKKNGLTLADNCVRTWFFVRDIDNNYHGLVVARREYFAERGLTRDTHYIASTGINGNPAVSGALVQMDTYTIEGIEPSQIKYLQGSSHLNPTAEYGVTFERATQIDYADRRHVIISGTASIDNRGQIVHPGDAKAQAERMLENIGVLLNEGGTSMQDLTHGIIYLRNASDYEAVRGVVEATLPDLPKVFVVAPVCRPGWLVEMECMAAKQQTNTNYKPY